MGTQNANTSIGRRAMKADINARESVLTLTFMRVIDSESFAHTELQIHRGRAIELNMSAW